MSKFLKQNKSFPYLIIEDDIMSKLRRIDYRDFIISHQDSKWSKWMFNGVTEEEQCFSRRILILYQWKPPFQVNEIHFNRSEYDEYIAQLHFSCLEEDVGAKSGGNLIISNTDYYLSIPEKELREYVHSEELINRQNNILRSLMVGGDFILYPYGHSLQSLLSEISYIEDGNISSDFKLVKKNSTDGPHWRVGQFW